MVKGFIQKEGEDFFDIYLSVVRLIIIRVLLLLVVLYGLIVY
ncbi:hypothetical protein EHS16_00630 [Streptococcus anginosus]|nr:hypothetical protein EHS16_00630 [Streptococcus anginosus]